MPLNLDGGGSVQPFVNYKAQMQVWEKSGEDGKTTFQFTKAVFDFDNIQTGWMKWDDGCAPEWVMDESIEKTAPKPTEGDWKRGFKVKIYSAQMFGSDPVREWATNGSGANISIGNIYSEYEQSRRDGMLPVIEYKGSVATKLGRGNSSIPQWEIVKWVERPKEMMEGFVPEVQQAAPLPVDNGADDEDEFPA